MTCVLNRAVQDCERRLNQSHVRPMVEVSFLPLANSRKRASASREYLQLIETNIFVFIFFDSAFEIFTQGPYDQILHILPCFSHKMSAMLQIPRIFPHVSCLGSAKTVQCPCPGPKISDKSQQIQRYFPLYMRILLHKPVETLPNIMKSCVTSRRVAFLEDTNRSSKKVFHIAGQEPF